MSSYWSATSGLALYLSEDEARDFFKQYLKQTFIPNPTDKDVENVMDNIIEYPDDCMFIKSKNRADTLKKLPELSYITKDFDETEDLLTDNISFEKINKRCPNSVFEILHYDSDEYSGGIRYSFDKVYDEDCKREVYETSYVNDGYIIWCDRSVLPQSFLHYETYTDMKEVIDECKAKLADYLPSDFDYKKHLGFIQFACFA